jgi:glycogen debranching enzyme
MIATRRQSDHDSIEYTIGEGHLAAGSTLGSPKAVAVVKATGALEKLYSSELGADVFGTVLIRHWECRSNVELQTRTGHFVIAPERQEHFVEYSQPLSSRERIFLVSARPRGSTHHEVDPPAAYYEVSLRNDGRETAEIRTAAAIRLAKRDGQISTRFDDRLNAFVVRAGNAGLVCIAAATITPESHEVTPAHVATFHFEHQLSPGETADFAIVLTFALDGEESARANLAAVQRCDDALARTQAFYWSVLDRAVVTTPEAEVNRGAQWAKANMLRCLLLTQQGWCIVNDPAETTHAVGRDTAWFSLGADYVAPWFAGEALRWFFEHLTDAGMVVEWYDTRTGATETDGLDMNDNTPLVIWAAWHHFCVTGDVGFLQKVYPNLLRAVRCIVSKRGARGLVWCHAPGKGGRGIVGWRNALQGHRLSGATTELNCECYRALRTAALIATELDDSAAAKKFARQAEELRAAINTHLLDPSRNLYYLGIDERGDVRTDVMADLVFPILFGVAEPEVEAKIIETLAGTEFWSEAGLRTVPRNSIDYAPADGSGLLGGVWAGPTFWFATAAAARKPELIADTLTVTFRHCAEDPLRYNTVPGQFCEWLQGETLTNCGMMLSPWCAPKYLWAAIEGAAGLDVTAQPPKLDRRLPPGWRWLAARNVMVRGSEISWFTVRAEELTTYLASSQHIAGADRHYDEDITNDIALSGEQAVCVALRRQGAVVVFVGNASERDIATSISMAVSRLPHRPQLRIYDGVARVWSERSDAGAGVWMVRVGRQDFSILEFAEENQ